ncbi:MAG: glycosyltransferase family 39 protein [Candidatus Micrarchaeia archaeon]|jgi:4-amino-4-deoxy-L-arabinose transferase-like glycosyltransferase
MDRKELAAVVILLLLALFLRLYNIDRPLYGDEADWLKSAKILVEGNSSWTNTLVSDNPPLGKALFVGAYALGLHDLRYVALLFGMAALAVTYLLARKEFGKRSALISLFLLATAAYAIVGAQHVDRDGGMLAFFTMLTLYAYMRSTGEKLVKERGLWLGVSLVAFIASVLLRTNMALLVAPVFALEYYRQEGGRLAKVGNAVKKLLPFAGAFALSFAFWLLLDNALGLQTMQRTFAHYLTYATGSNQDLQARLLRTAVSVARVGARLTVPMALALCVAAYALWKARWELGEKEKELLVVCGAWILVGVLTVLLVTQGNVPAYFDPFVLPIMLVVGHAISKMKKASIGFAVLVLVLAFLYLRVLQYADFNEVNLLLMPVAGLAAVALAGMAWIVDRGSGRLVLALAVMSLFASAFLLMDFRTYDAMRSQAVADAAAYFNGMEVQKIAESQERTLDLYASGRVVQYDGGRCVKVDGRQCTEEDGVSTFPVGYYVVDFPLRPLELPDGIGAMFRFNLFDKSGVEKCELVRTYELHGVVVSEFYKC